MFSSCSGSCSTGSLCESRFSYTSRSLSSQTIAIIVAVVVGVVLILPIVLICCIIRRRRHRGNYKPSKIEETTSPPTVSRMSPPRPPLNLLTRGERGEQLLD